LMTCVLSIADNCIIEEVHCKLTLIARRDTRQKLRNLSRRQGKTLTEEIHLFCNLDAVL
jgi:hypothetical protein